MIIEPDQPSLNRYYPFLLLVISAIKDFIKISRCQGPYIVYKMSMSMSMIMSVVRSSTLRCYASPVQDVSNSINTGRDTIATCKVIARVLVLL